MRSLRQLARHPGSSLVIVLTLALGIGVNTAMFGFLDRLLIRPLPVARPHELAVLADPDARGIGYGHSYPLYLDYRERNTVFSHLVAQASDNLGLGIDGATRRVRAILVSGDYFEMLGITPAVGRTFAQNEGRTPGDAPVLLLGHGFWRRAFGADPGVVGRSVTLNGRSFTVIGVTPSEFSGTELGVLPEVYVPITMRPMLTPSPAGHPGILETRKHIWHQVLGRLKPGVTHDQAQVDMRWLAGQIHASGAENVPTNLVVLPAASGIAMNFRDARLPLWLMGVIVVLVLVVACANVAGLQIARGAAKSRELAVRLALGAGRTRLLLDWLAESAWLSLLGGLAGLGVARVVALGLATFRPPDLSEEQMAAFVRLDLRVLAFTGLATLSTVLVAGLLPALSVVRTESLDALKSLSSSSSASAASSARRGPRRAWGLRACLVSGQVALATVCVISAALCARSIQNLLRVEPGFEPARVLAAELNLALNQYSPPRSRHFFDQLLLRLRALPGIEAASLASATPLGNSHRRMSVERIDGFAPRPDEFIVWYVSVVAPDYFRTLGTPFLRGRDFGPQDTADSAKVILVNQAAADRYWPGQDPVGRQIYQSGFDDPTEVPYLVVGVVANASQRSLDARPEPAMYRPLSQDPESALTLLVRTTAQPEAATALVSGLVRELDPAVPVFRIRTLAQQQDASLVLQRLAASSLGGFALLALLLAALGVHGLLAFDVHRRTRELGIRIALGARLHQIVALVLRDGLRLVGVGAGTGLVLGLIGARSLRGFLHGIAPDDPGALGMSILILLLAAAVAAWLPAARAARVDPNLALRAE